jgi:hypothetical protein
MTRVTRADGPAVHNKRAEEPQMNADERKPKQEPP